MARPDPPRHSQSPQHPLLHDRGIPPSQRPRSPRDEEYDVLPVRPGVPREIDAPQVVQRGDQEL